MRSPAPTLSTAPAWALALCLCLEFLGSCGGGTAQGSIPRGRGGRGVLLVAVDSLRADRMSFAGYDRETTPVLDGLLEHGVAFTQTFSAAPGMIASHAGILMACDPTIARQPLPEDAGVMSLLRRWRIPDSAPSLAVEFLADGFATRCFVDHSWLAPNVGFRRGFEDYDVFLSSALEDEADFGASQLGRRVLDWIRSMDADRDWFAYVHINDLERSMRHSDTRWNTYFEPREEMDMVPPVVDSDRAFFAISRKFWRGGHQTIGEYEASYDGYVRQLDNRLGRLFAVLDNSGRLDEMTVCVVGTYGVGFGEAGLYLDHGTLADVDLHVPWVIKFPAYSDLPRGQTCSSLASLLDVGPTLLELAGLKVPDSMHGRSQIPSLSESSGPPVREFAFSQGGVSLGFAVHDSRYSFQATSHANNDSKALRMSWYGTTSQGKQRRLYLRDRRDGSGPGDLAPPAVDGERSASLLLAGEEWFEWIEQARIALHDPPWLRGTQSEELLVELVNRKLISEPVARRLVANQPN